MGSADFDHAILRAVAGIEKKRSILVGVEKEVVARHEAGHALVATAVRILIPTSAAVEKLSIIPRTGGALGCTRFPFLDRVNFAFLCPEWMGGDAGLRQQGPSRLGTSARLF